MLASIYYDTQAKAIASLRDKIAQGIDIREVLDPTSTVFGSKRTARMKVLERLDRIKGFGRGQVQDELKRQ